ncbi:hypothetical protein EZMO1_4176 [Endozoicomonas montiporae CL-33]|uniref:Uncharacterized protein n=1 Tax=Endozoicomonas montiporae CL-33 TaxID=570277 RepID=A0A142BH74_9GAMM|nr:hypothetical protein [Endozoicomonas montiporae]AMO58100.1 hypothetical protein EZMO1_4176 [Endozoicomonas montiporae CL-33]
MSNARAKAERSKAKDARQQPAPDKALKKKGRKKARPVTVMIKYQEQYKEKSQEIFQDAFWWKEPFKLGCYRTEGEAQKAIELKRRKCPGLYLFSLDGIHYS